MTVYFVIIFKLFFQNLEMKNTEPPNDSNKKAVPDTDVDDGAKIYTECSTAANNTVSYSYHNITRLITKRN